VSSWNFGSVVDGHPQLELGSKSKELLVELPRRNRVPACELLNERLVQVTAKLDLGGGNQPRATKARQDRWNATLPPVQQRREGVLTASVAAAAEHFEEGAFPVGPTTVEKKEHLLCSQAVRV